MGTSPSPSEQLSLTDPGDETQRNFRYQHAYGVILIVAGLTTKEDYVAIWCEHHEDLLAELRDGRFDAFQIKTSTPEAGWWQTNDPDLETSFVRFIKLDVTFAERFRRFVFVSNTQALDSHAAAKIHLSPWRFLEAAKEARSAESIAREHKPFLVKLASNSGSTQEQVCTCLRRIVLQQGPSRSDFETFLAHTCLPALPECNGLTPSSLNEVREDLIALVARASSITNENPFIYMAGGELSARLRQKRVEMTEARLLVAERGDVPFRFTTATPIPPLGDAASTSEIAERKFVRGELASQVESLKSRAFSAERAFLERTQIDSESAQELLVQASGVVLGECAEAEATARLAGTPFGLRKLVDVYARLSGIAKDRPEMVAGLQKEHLIGLAALLTGACKIWWSDPFKLDEDQL